MNDSTPKQRPAVLHVNTERTWRGGEQQTLYLLNGLKKRGFKSLLIAKEGGEMAKRARDAGHEVLTMRMRGEIDFSVPARIIGLINKHRFNILHAHTSHAHAYISLAAAPLGKRGPCVVVHRRVDFSIFRRSFLGLNHIKYLYGVDRYITVSHAIKRVLEIDGVPGDRITTVHSGIDIERIDYAEDKRAELRSEFGVAEDETVIANVAHFADHKGQIYLIEAMPEILKRYPKVRCAIVGHGELKDELMEKCRELGIFDRMIFPGFRNDIPAILKAVDLFVMPSHTEGLGTSVLDAMAARLPVVGTEAGGMPEMFNGEENGLVCPIRDSKAITEAVCRFLADPQWAKSLGMKARKVVEKGFSTDSMVEGNLAVYRDLLALRRKRRLESQG
jgi:L-malate glycosyltransferase